MTTDELKGLRKALGLTQSNLAERLGIGLKTYGEMENGPDEIPERYRLAVERVALSIAVERENPMLASAATRKEALALARLITGE